MNTCRVCGTELADGAFCGHCGAPRSARRGDGPDWLRLRSFAAAPHEHLLLPVLTSSLFPQLPTRTLVGFRIGLAVMTLALVGAAVFRLPGTLIATATVGLPLLFVLYLRQVGYAGGLAGRLIAAAALGAGLGVAFAVVSGHVVAQSYGVPLESGVAAIHLRTTEAEVSAIAALVALTPAILIRLFWVGKRETLRGFAIGALGAMSVAAAELAVRMFAQLSSGLVDRDQPFADLLIEAGIRGITVPVIAATAGGLMGAALWFDSDRRRGPLRWTLLGMALVSVLAHVWLGEEDAAGISQWAKVAWHVAVALIALVLLRVGLQLALLSERAGVDGAALSSCTYCGNIVPNNAFCASCGVATAGRTPSHVQATGRLLATWAAVVAVLALALIGVSAQTSKPDERYLCPPNCGRPPMGQPMAVNPVFTAADGGFTVSYPAAGAAYSVTTDDTGVTAQFLGGDGGVMRLFGQAAHGRSARDIATDLAQDAYPDSRMAYELPNTLVGYQPGYGMALDDWPDGSNVVNARTRILVMVAVKDDLALIAAAAGPYHVFGSDSGPPTGVSLELAQDMGKYVNSFRWRGDPVR